MAEPFRNPVLAALFLLAALNLAGFGRANAATPSPPATPLGPETNTAATHRGDGRRSGFFPVELTLPLRLAWRYEAAAPRPAWGAPARRSYWQRLEHLDPRVAYERVHPAVVTADAVYFGSSADDQVRCLDLATGRLRWRFFAAGPVRYAPTVAYGKVYFGSDDGSIYAVRCVDGQLAWRHRPAPEASALPGNGRMISPWPVRSGVLVLGDTVYATFGLYPQQGVQAWALDAGTGESRWSQSLEVSPEGYLLGTDRLLIVPTGRSSPVGLDRATGRYLRTFASEGGTYAVVANDELVVGPGNAETLTSTSETTGQRLVAFQGRDLVATRQRSWLLRPGEVVALDRARQAELKKQAAALQTQLLQLESAAASTTTPLPQRRAEIARLGRQLADNRQAQASAELWRTASPEDLALIGTENLLFAGGSNSVAGLDPTTGRRLWQAPVHGQALALAATSNTLVVSTDLGTIEVFSPSSASTSSNYPSSPLPPTPAPAPAPAPPATHDQVTRLLAESSTPLGYALVAGVGSGALIRELVARSRWQIVVADTRAERITTLRQELADAGFYGTRVSVFQAPEGILPFTDFFANIVVSENGLERAEGPRWPEAELERVTRPFGGVRWTAPDQRPERRGEPRKAGEWTHQFGNPGNTSSSNDQALSPDLVLQWFGGPGPDVMVDRHLRGPAPLSARGRMFVPGENRLLAVDAYNGTVLWQRELPGSQRYSMPYDAGYQSVFGDLLAVAVRDECWLIEAGTGEIHRRWPLPTPHDSRPLALQHWGYTVLRERALFGTAQRATASRTVPSYEQIDADYNHDQPLVTGRAVFRLDPESGRTVWLRERGVILNPTLALAGPRVYFVEGRARPLAGHPTGRIPLKELLAGDPWVVALDADTGAVEWEHPLASPVLDSRSILYLSATSSNVVLLGSRPTTSGDGDTEYGIECLRTTDGRRVWSATHREGKPGAFSHGEQVHHPVLLGDLLVAEPAIYQLTTGRRLSNAAGTADWQLVRPGHSCGTLSGAGDCLFFRANNPTVLDVRASLNADFAPRKLAPSRTGCWINMVPAGGLLLVPEASAGCVCQYSLQTSMAFRPRPAR